jgi:glycosyltransferase involved in cell wall biosynthesis
MPEPLVALDARLVTTQNTGDTAYWRGLLYGLAQIDPRPKILLLSDQPKPDFLPADFFPWHQISAPHQRLWSLLAFPRAARQLGAQVVHTQYNLSPMTKIPGVTTIHDVSFLINPEWYAPKDRLILKGSIPKTVDLARKILTVSETSKREINSHLPRSVGKVIVTPNALGPDFIPFSKTEAKSLLPQIASPFVFTITSRWARKNTALAAQAFQLSGAATTHQLVTCGPGEPLLSNSLHLGYVNDQTIRALYAAADCYILPSLHEGFGIPILEAFASQTPVLAGNGGAIPEVADGNATLCQDYNPQTWANALNQILTDSGKLKAQIESGMARAKEFSWIKTAEITADVYRRVANGS